MYLCLQIGIIIKWAIEFIVVIYEGKGMQGMAVLSCWVLGALQGAILILIPQMMLQGQLSAMQLAIPLSLGTFIFLYCSGRWGQLLDARCADNKSIIFVLRWALFGFLIS